MLNYVLAGSLDGRGAWGRRDTCICMAESRCCVPRTVTMLLITYAPVYNKVLKNWCVSSRASRFYSAVNDSDGEFWSLPVFCLDHSRQHSPSLCTPSTLCAWSCAVSLHPCLASVTNFCDCSACSWNSPWRLSLPISIPVILRQFQGRF